MKSVFIAGSRKFFNEIEELVQTLKNKDIKVTTAGKLNEDQKDTFKSEKNSLLKAFKELGDADIIYIFANEGYIGKTVAMEIAYAFAKDKKIISSQKIKEFSAQALISETMIPKKLIEYCK